MSWWAKTIANSLGLEDDGDGDEDEDRDRDYNENAGKHSVENTSGGNLHENDIDPKSPEKLESDPRSSSTSPTPTTKGVKDDLSELTKTISRQFWGVASFLAPPPDQHSSHNLILDPEHFDQPELSRGASDLKASEEDVISGIRSDFAEISVKFKSGISKLSTNKTVSEISKIASSFLQFGSEEERLLNDYNLDGVVGVTEDVVAFARSISQHPKTWLDFPLPNDADSDDFELNDVQQEHALVVEHLAPSLAALRRELCPEYMSEGSFWKIYFVLLHPRLNEEDAHLLSTRQIVETRTKLMQEQQSLPEGNKASYLLATDNNMHSKDIPDTRLELKISATEAAPSTVESNIEMEKHPIQSSETQIVDKPVIEEEPVNFTKRQHPFSASSRGAVSEKFDEDAGEEWLREETSEMVGASGTSIPIYGDDVSFSDLEDDDDDNVLSSHRKVASSSDSSTKDSRDWVQLNRSSVSEHVNARNSDTKESNDWLNVDDIDVM